MIFSRLGDTRFLVFFSFLCFLGIFNFIDSRGFIRMFTGAGVGGTSCGTGGDGEDRGEVRGVREVPEVKLGDMEEDKMEGDEMWGDDDAWLVGLPPPPMLDRLLGRAESKFEISHKMNFLMIAINLILKYLLTLGPEDEGLS